jgi:hypothetical protein
VQRCLSKSIAWIGNLRFEECDNRLYIQNAKWGTAQLIECLHDFQLGVVSKSLLYILHIAQ